MKYFKSISPFLGINLYNKYVINIPEIKGGKNLIKKIITIIVLIITILGATSIGCSNSLKIKEPANNPNLILGEYLSLEPPEPDGENEWYITKPYVVINYDLFPSHSAWYYRIDQGGWLTCTGPIHLDWSDGTHSFEIKIITMDQNEIHDGVYFKLDTTPPEIELTKDKGDLIYINAEVSDETSHIQNVEFYFDDSLAKDDNEGPEYDLTIAIDSFQGEHLITAIAYDNAGNSAKSNEILLERSKSKNIHLFDFLQFFPFLSKILKF